MSSPLLQLTLMRLRMWRREPEGLFWMFGFPLIATAVLGFAFRTGEPEPISVVVISGEGSETLERRLSTSTGLEVKTLDEVEARRQLRKGNAAVLVAPAPEPRILLDRGQENGVAATMLVREALDRTAGRPGLLEVPIEEIRQPGSRFVDFFIPGILGFSLLNTSLSELAYVIVNMRSGRLLRRLSATPLRKQSFLGAFVIVRGLIAILEITAILLIARFIFGVPMLGSYPLLMAIALVGAASFTGLALLVASRARSAEEASGIANLITMPMAILCGVFFSTDRFPEWIQPVLSVLPLTALNDALRGVMLDGLGVSAVAAQMGIVMAWGAGTFLVALKAFRWQ